MGGLDFNLLSGFRLYLAFIDILLVAIIIYYASPTKSLQMQL